MLNRDAKKTAVADAKNSEQANCEMENAKLRFTDMRSNAGQLTFLKQVCYHLFWFETHHCWRSSSGFGKKVNFSLALVHTINCPKAHNKTRCSGI